jgi:hypothetical protein
MIVKLESKIVPWAYQLLKKADILLITTIYHLPIAISFNEQRTSLPACINACP